MTLSLTLSACAARSLDQTSSAAGDYTLDCPAGEEHNALSNADCADAPLDGNRAPTDGNDIDRRDIVPEPAADPEPNTLRDAVGGPAGGPPGAPR